MFVYDRMERQVFVTAEPMTQQDAAKTSEEPKWQTDWNSEYIAKSGFDIYALKTQERELIALGAYEIIEDVIAVHIVYMESQSESNPTLSEHPKYRGIGRAGCLWHQTVCGLRLQRRRDPGRKDTGACRAL